MKHLLSDRAGFLVKITWLVSLTVCGWNPSRAADSVPGAFTDPPACYSPIKDALLKKCQEIGARNPAILDAGFTPSLKTEYEVPVGADVKEGFYTIIFKVGTRTTSGKKVCKVVSVAEVSRHPHE